MTKRLNNKQAAFVAEYMKDWNATQAAIRAGYSERGARHWAAELLTRPAVKAAVAELQAAARSSAIMDHIEACEILTAVARGNVGDYLNADGGIDTDRLKKHCPAAVAGIETATRTDGDGDVVTVTKFRLADRVRAIERLAKMRGWDQPARVDVTPTAPMFVLPAGLDYTGSEFSPDGN